MSEIDNYGRDYYTIYDKSTGTIRRCGYVTGDRPWKKLEANEDITFKRSDHRKHKVKVDGIDIDGKRKTVIIEKEN